jgi:hypothetical protein
MEQIQADEHMKSLLETAMQKLKTEAKTVIDGIMGDLYCDYLPHVIGDTEANLGNRVSGVIRNLIGGKFEKCGESMVKVSDSYGFETYVSLNSYDDMVRPLCDLMGPEIVGARVQQLENEVARLTQQLNDSYRR